jgi:hypothetical protein
MLRSKLALFEHNINNKLLTDGSVVDLSYDKSVKSSKALTSKDAALIARLLKNPNCPNNLTLNLARNNLGNEGVDALKAAIKSGHSKLGLKIDLHKNNTSSTVADELNGLIVENDRILKETSQIREAAIRCLQFRLGYMHQTRFSNLSKDTITKIFEFTYPCEDGINKKGIKKSKCFADKIMAHTFFVKRAAKNRSLDNTQNPSLNP